MSASGVEIDVKGHSPTEHQRKILHGFCNMMRIRKNAMEILTSTTPHMISRPCANSHCMYGSNIHLCCHSECRPIPSVDSPHRQMNVASAIMAAASIAQSSIPTNWSMRART